MINVPAAVLCMSGCSDFEVRAAQVVNHQDSSAVNIDMVRSERHCLSLRFFRPFYQRLTPLRVALQLKKYKAVWSRFDPYGAGYMDLHFLKRCAPVCTPRFAHQLVHSRTTAPAG